MEEIMINVFSVIGNPLCVETKDGQKVYDLISHALKENKKVKLSFQNIEMITSAFLNTAIGQLYGNFDEAMIKSSVSVEHLSPLDMTLLKRVTTTAKLFYKDPERMSRSIDEILGETDGK